VFKNAICALSAAGVALAVSGDPVEAAIDLAGAGLAADPSAFSYSDTADFFFVDGLGVTILDSGPSFVGNNLVGGFDLLFDDGAIAFSATGSITGADTNLLQILFAVNGVSPFGTPYALMSLSGSDLGSDPSPLLGLTGPDGAFGLADLTLTAVKGTSVIPLPAGLPLLLTGTGMLFLLRMRYRKAE
jgi:hypothetical protein